MERSWMKGYGKYHADSIFTAGYFRGGSKGSGRGTAFRLDHYRAADKRTGKAVCGLDRYAQMRLFKFTDSLCRDDAAAAGGREGR